MTAAATPVTSAGRWLPIGELLDLDDQRGAPCWGTFNRVAEARKRYCGLTLVPLEQARPCAGCGSRSTTLVGDMPLHLTCPDPDPEAAAAVRAAARAEAADAVGPAADPPPRRDAGGGAGGQAETPELLAAVLAEDGLWLPGADAPVAAGWPQDAGQAYELAARHRVRQLWIHPGAHARLGLPAAHGPNPQAPEQHPWAQPPGYACDPPGLAAWMQVAPAGGGRRRAVVLPRFEHRASWLDAPSGQVLLGAVTALAGALPAGCNYYYSPNVTAATVINHHHRGGLAPASMPQPAADRVVTHVASWSRTLMDEEAGRAWLHRYDTNGAQLATWNVKLGVGDPVHVTAPEWTPRKSKYVAGYWLISVADGWRPDPRLPDLLIPWRRAGQPQIWVPTPFLELLADDLAAPVTIAEAWLWPQSSAWLETAGHSFRDARAALGAQADGCGKCAWCIALRTVKDCYTSQIGNFARRPGEQAGEQAAPASDPLRRPDVTDHIIPKALANDYRRLARVGKATGRWPVAIFNDAVYYASDIEDARDAAPPGIVIGAGLGQYSVETTVPLDVVAADLGERGFHRAVERYLKGRR